MRDDIVAVAFEFAKDEAAATAAAFVLVALARKGAAVDPGVLIASSAAAIRQAGVALWCANPIDADIGQRLAEDPSPGVRVELARGHAQLGSSLPDVASSLRSTLSGDISAHVRSVLRMRNIDRDA